VDRAEPLLREYLILSRGGQGGVTASRILATAAVLEGKYAQAIPQFGAERRGAIVRSYLRISDEPIKRHSRVKQPVGVSVFSARILELMDLNSIAPTAKRVLVNSSKPVHLGDREVFYVDATSIALELNLVIAGWPVVNTAMAAAMAKVFEIASLDSILEAMKNFFHGKLLEANLEAARRAWDRVRKA